MQKITFSHSRDDFYLEVKKRVKDFLEKYRLPEHDDWRMYLKSGIVFSTLIAAYITLVFHTPSLELAILIAFVIAQCFALVGFNIQHDGNHNTFSRFPLVNNLLGHSLNLIGGLRWVWLSQHNRLHHTYTNIHLHDNDINLGPLARLCLEQAWKPWHRFQHVYIFILYAFTTLSWVFFSDPRRFFTGKIGDYHMPKKTISDYVIFFVSKGTYFGYTLILPSFFHPFWHVLLFFIGIHLVTGFTLAIVFQLAHTVDNARFVVPDDDGKIDNEWAIHQVETTSDFATQNRFLAWYLGGLNFQVVHHLFFKICHVRYPDIVKIVQKTCAEFGITYVVFPSFLTAVASHIRHLKKMGQKPALSPA